LHKAAGAEEVVDDSSKADFYETARRAGIEGATISEVEFAQALQAD
jgi:hypothetical protein